MVRATVPPLPFMLQLRSQNWGRERIKNTLSNLAGVATKWIAVPEAHVGFVVAIEVWDERDD